MTSTPPPAGPADPPSEPTPVRLLVVDDDPLVRAGLALMLGGADDVEIVGEGADGAEVPELVDRLAPDVVLMDIRMPGVDGLTATERLRARPGAPEVVVLTTFHADEQVLRALRAGAAGFLLKDTPPGEIVTAVRRVAAGDPVLSPAVTRQLMSQVARRTPAPAPDAPAPETPAAERPPSRRALARERLATLAEREREVAVCVGQGRSNAEIAGTLYMSVPTVKTHVSRILAKLGLNNRVQIALLVHDAGLLDLPDGEQAD
ncbi:response regulator transcription factor [Streptomyces sp. SKN60]|uniref:response regulator n=1 Tax=Streptomyces sp. SKN60 TaxID=2855506 RepID=UPI00224855C1|nr:response regulator transcription factor [Streptomyces sp. SKN60]MCX2184636.1 response regulator transcription factor [Streptomyces sp. SKN60]